MVAVSETPNPREEFSFADRGKLIAELRAENERLWRIEEAARRLMDSPAGNRYGFLPLLNALEGETPDVASEPEDR